MSSLPRYEPQYVWWEMVVLLRKAIFVVMTIFVRSQGPVAQVIAAVLVLVVALSLQLRYTPYEEDDHDRLESASLHASTICLPVVLLVNEFSRGEKQGIGVLASIVVIIVILGFTLILFGMFFWFILRGSHDHPGALGKLAHKFYPNAKQVRSEKKRIRDQLREMSRKKHVRQATHRNLKRGNTAVMPAKKKEEEKKVEKKVNPKNLRNWVTDEAADD